MEYPVIVEQKNGVWRAVIPVLADLSAEGASRDEAMKNAQRAAEDYLSKGGGHDDQSCAPTRTNRASREPSGVAEGDRGVRRRRGNPPGAFRGDR